jgi:hypothetical protein
VTLADAILLLDASKDSLVAFAKFSDVLQSSNRPVFVAIPVDLAPERLPPLCRELPPAVLPLLRLGREITEAKPQLLSAALGRPVVGACLNAPDMWARTDLTATPGDLLAQAPSLAEEDCFRIANRICLSTDYFAADDRVSIDLASLDPALGTVEQVARLSAHLSASASPTATLHPTCGGWLDRAALHGVSEELTATLRTPQSCLLSLAEAFSVIVRALSQPDASEWLWHPLSGPVSHPQTGQLATTAGAIRKAATYISRSLVNSVPNTVPVDGFPVAAAAYLQTAAEIVRDNPSDNQIIRIAPVPNADFRLALAALRRIPEDQRDSCRNGFLSRSWETARI